MALITGNKLTYKNGAWNGSTIPLVKTSDNWWTSNYPIGAGADPTENITNMNGSIYSLNNSLTAADDNIFNHNILPDGYDMRVSFGNPAQSNLYPQKNPDKSSESIDDLIKRFQGMDAWDALKLQWKMNPIGTTMGLVGGIGQLGNSIWSAFQDYKTSKKMLNLEQDKYNLQKQMYEANEARNQEKFNWLRQARSTSQL